MTHENEPVEAELLAHGLDVGHERLAGVIAVGRPLAVAMTTLVEVDQAEAVGGALAELVEHVAGDAETVQGEDDGGTVGAPLLVGQPQVATGGGRALAVGGSQDRPSAQVSRRARLPRASDDSTGGVCIGAEGVRRPSRCSARRPSGGRRRP